MKAKYKHEGNECLIYDQVICEDNIVVTATTVKSYYGSWCDVEPQPVTKVCLTNAEARRMFYLICDKFEKQRFECLYKEETKWKTLNLSKKLQTISQMTERLLGTAFITTLQMGTR